MKEFRPDPKPEKRKVRRDAGKSKLVKEQTCRICPNRASDRHHLVSRSLGGDDHDDNLIPLCHRCHMDYEHSPTGREVQGSRIRASLTSQELIYIVTKKGEDFLNRMYPLSKSASIWLTAS